MLLLNHEATAPNNMTARGSAAFEPPVHAYFSVTTTRRNAAPASAPAAEPGQIIRSTSRGTGSGRLIAVEPPLQRGADRPCTFPRPTAFDRQMHQILPRGQAK
jgi:hypothetical protein